MTALFVPLFLAMQVGPAPNGIELEPLPIPRRPTEAQNQEPTPADQVKLATAHTVSGNQAIVNGDFERALEQFDEARVAAVAAGEPRMVAQIGLDSSRALILLERYDEAASVLEAVRKAIPEEPEAWVNSSVVARRLGKLDEAQSLIEQGAQRAPRDPGIGLEAGTVAYYAGRSDAAKQSWQSVVDVAPETDEAALATSYLEMLASEQVEPKTQ